MYRDDLIRAAQAAQNLTDEQLAEKSGIGRTTISFVTNGKAKDPRISTLKAIADALGLKLEDLFTPKENVA